MYVTGKAWTADYGDPHVAEDFDFIHPISPLHNVPDQELPPTILLTADRMSIDVSIGPTLIFSTDDDRVVPLHTFKLAATLQHKLPHNPHPLLVRIEQKAGHGAGKSTEKRSVFPFSHSPVICHRRDRRPPFHVCCERRSG